MKDHFSELQLLLTRGVGWGVHYPPPSGNGVAEWWCRVCYIAPLGESTTTAANPELARAMQNVQPLMHI